MVQGSAFLVAGFVGVAVWLTVMLIRHPDGRIDTAIKALFAAYVVVVVASTMFPIPLEGARAGQALRINVVPFRGILGVGNISRVQAAPNVLLAVPFGFGAFWVWPRARPLQVLGLGLGFFLGIEIVQVAITQLFPAAPRTGDINDVMLNTLGVGLGIGLFLGFAAVLRQRDDRGDLGSSVVMGVVRAVIAPRS
jgi:glycopeptide antibiotics resistance protein